MPSSGSCLDLLLSLRQLAVLGDDDLVGRHGSDVAGFLGDDDGPGIARDFAFHSRADERRLGDEQRHPLALHVRAHQRAVRIVVLEERNQAGRDGNELLRRNVHVVDLRRFDFEEVAAIARLQTFSLGELPLRRRSARSPERR